MLEKMKNIDIFLQIMKNLLLSNNNKTRFSVIILHFSSQYKISPIRINYYIKI